MTREEKLQLNRDRQKAVRNAWKRESTLVLRGHGTRDWNMEQQRQLIDNGKVDGFFGHHMKSVDQYSEYVADSNNIQFLNKEEHKAAHDNGLYPIKGYNNPTNGYYDVSTKTTKSFGEQAPVQPEAKELSNPIYKENFLDNKKQGKEQTYSSQKNKQLQR